MMLESLAARDLPYARTLKTKTSLKKTPLMGTLEGDFQFKSRNFHRLHGTKGEQKLSTADHHRNDIGIKCIKY